MKIQTIKTDLLSVIETYLQNVAVSYDFATAVEASAAAVIKDLSFTYVNDLEIHEQITLSFSVLLVAKENDELFSMVDNLSKINGEPGDGKFTRWFVVEKVDILGTDDTSSKYAQIFINCNVNNSD